LELPGKELDISREADHIEIAEFLIEEIEGEIEHDIVEVSQKMYFS